MKKTTDNPITTSPEYENFLGELKGILDTGLHTAYKAVDNIKVQTYWQLGERIVREELKYQERAEYGAFLLKKLSVDLSMRERNLYEIVDFYKAYPTLRTLSAKLSWSQYIELSKVKSEEERGFYERKSLQYSWSVRNLKEQIRNNLYQNSSPEEVKAVFQTKPPETVALEIFKNDTSAYDFGFFPLGAKYLEKDIEDGIVRNIDIFLKEMGEDFCFVGRQVPIKIDGKTHAIDLVLFHKGIPCTVLVDLKSNKIESGDIGQMNKYVSYWRQNRQYAYEKNAIGLVLGREAGREEIAYAIEGLEEKIFVATYKAKFPDEEKLKKAVQKLM